MMARPRALLSRLSGKSAGTLVGAAPAQSVASDGAGSPLFVPPGHFYSPIPNRTDVARHFERLAEEGIPLQVPGISIGHPQMVMLWKELEPYMRGTPFRASKTGNRRFHFDNPAFSWGDASILHAILRHSRPHRLIEIGSGWSSACTLDTVEHELAGACRLTFIEPHAELLRILVGGTTLPIEIIEQPVQVCPMSLFDDLRSGDILFVDSTHVLKTGSDVWFILFRLLPRLRSGVVVHFHDVFWPFEYLQGWALDQNRAWNEIYALQAFLTDNHSWDILFFNDYFRRFEHDLIKQTYPRFLHNTGGSLWLRKI